MNIYDLFTPPNIAEEMRRARADYWRVNNSSPSERVARTLPCPEEVDPRTWEFCMEFLQNNNRLPREEDVVRFCIRNRIPVQIRLIRSRRGLI